MQQFLDDLASAAPTPGGGGAAAIIGAMGAALVSMVANLTIGKEKYREVDAEMRSILEKAQALRARLTAMMDEDVRVFDAVMAAYRLPRDDEGQKAERGAAIQAALKDATDVPLACARVCAELIELCGRAAALGNVNVISDAGVGVLAANAALRSAALNVYINAGNIKDAGFVDPRVSELEQMLSSCAQRTEAVYQLVKSKL